MTNNSKKTMKRPTRQGGHIATCKLREEHLANKSNAMMELEGGHSHHHHHHHNHRHPHGIVKLKMVCLLLLGLLAFTLYGLSIQKIPFRNDSGSSATPSAVTIPSSVSSFRKWHTASTDIIHSSSDSNTPPLSPPSSYSTPFCNQLATTSGMSPLSTPLVWQALLSQIVNASVAAQSNPVESFASWANDLIQYYDADALQRSVGASAPYETLQTILQVIQHYLDKSNNGNTKQREPLRILVAGGSVTFGSMCNNNFIGQSFHRSPSEGVGGVSLQCSWPHRLEALLNHVFFQGEPVVQITNIAKGGYSSSVTAMIINYRLYLEEFPECGHPHMILWAHAANDRGTFATKEESYQVKEEFIAAAQRLRPCDDNLPLIAMVDDFVGGGGAPHVTIEESQVIRRVAEWHQLPLVSYPNAIRHSLYGSLPDPKVAYGLFSSDWVFHLGMGFHVGMSWVVLYNFLNMFVDGCNHELLLSSIRDASNYNMEHPLHAGDKPIKYIPPLVPGLGFKEMNDQWQQQMSTEYAKCNGTQTFPACEFSWIKQIEYDNANSSIERSLAPYMAKNQGWRFESNITESIKPGWYAYEPHAVFTLHIPITKSPPAYFTILILKSYEATPFKGARVKVTLEVHHATGTSKSSTALLEGIHDLTASLVFPIRIPLPAGTQMGDQVRLSFDLISGSRFMIAGMALCNR
jgi:hypothetical protein